jgi:hypothetical protein
MCQEFIKKETVGVKSHMLNHHISNGWLTKELKFVNMLSLLKTPLLVQTSMSSDCRIIDDR